MKKRLGFVSNSSSTSFCIAGYYTDKEELMNKIEEVSLPEGVSTYRPDDYSFYIGLDIEKMGDNETKKEFCERATKILKELIPELEGLATIEHYGWYNG